MLRPKRRGEGNIKLTEDEVVEIHLARGRVKRKVLAARYGVDPSTISKVWYGQNWSAVKMVNTDEKPGLQD